MKRSERQLLFGLIAVLGVFVVIPAIWGFLSGPVKLEQGRLTTAESKLKKETDSFDLSLARIKSMSLYKEQSLSSNSSQGALAYQQWLTDLTEIVANFADPEVAPERVSLSRDKSYVAVRMRVNGIATVEQLQTFLYHFHRANVLHRLVSLTVEAQNNSTSPRVSARMIVEALSLRDAPVKGATLFARTAITQLDEDQPGLISVESTDGFPEKAPFQIRIGSSYHEVINLSDAGWQIAVSEDDNLNLNVEDLIEHAPVHPDYVDATEGQFLSLIEKNPFAKPAPYRPRLDLIGEKTIVHGESLELSPKATGFDLSAGDPDYAAISELPAGMTLEGGQLKWSPPEDLEPADYAVSIRATAAGLREPLEAEFTLTLRKVNNPPQLEIPSGLVAVLGQPTSFTVTATDAETASDALRFALGDGAPEGVSINETTGELTWTPSAELTPGEVSIPIQVSDDGEPAQSAQAQASIEVQDDRAMFTYLTGSVARDGIRQAWLHDRSTDKRVVLLEGGQLEYAGFDALVLSIGDDFVLLQQKDDTLQLKIGTTLRDALVIASIEPVEAAEPAETAEENTETTPAQPADAATTQTSATETSESDSSASETSTTEESAETDDTAEVVESAEEPAPEPEPES